MPNRAQNIFLACLQNDRFLLGCACLLTLGKRLLLLPFELNYEEGKEIECILNILSGKLVFRDFHWQYGPLGIYLTALLFKVSGAVNLLIPRGMVSLAATAATYYAYKTARIHLPPAWAFWAALMSASGLVARENTYGHAFAYLGMLASFYYLSRLIRGEADHRAAILSGLSTFIVLLAKPVLFGAGAVFCGAASLLLWGVLMEEKKRAWSACFYFLLCSVAPGLLVYGFLTAQTSFATMYSELFPMASGTLNMKSSLPIKPLLPDLRVSSAAGLAASLNYYLVEVLRWWLILLSTLGGAGVIAVSIYRGGKKLPAHLPLLLLLIYGLLIECETLIMTARPATFFINMLPTYVILGIFFIWLRGRGGAGRAFVYAASAALCCIYYLYPAGRAAAYHFANSQPLGLKYAETVRVPEYTRAGYNGIAQYVRAHAPADKPILFAGYDSFIYLFSGRSTPFPEDFTAFVKTSFHPYNLGGSSYPAAFFELHERKIIERARAAAPSMILVPSAFITEQAVKNSSFLQYLAAHWLKVETLNSSRARGPFDKIDLQIDVFVPKKGNDGGDAPPAPPNAN